MGDLSPHFDLSEFKCGCGKSHDIPINPALIEKLEKLYTLMNAHAVIITSGFRCPEYSRSLPGGYFNDAHTKGIAADIMVVRNANGKPYYDAESVAECAERVGFSGIGIIDGFAVHVDIRDNTNYVNSHWFGDERTGNDNIQTFQRGTVFDGENENAVDITVTINNTEYKGKVKKV